MKRILILLLALLLLLCACADPAQPMSPGTFLYYYPAETPAYSAKDGAFVTVAAQSSEEVQMSETLVRTYLDAKAPEGAQQVIPKQWTLSSAEQDGATFLMVFTGKIVSPLQKSLTAACLAKTILQIPEIQRISITCPGSDEPLILTGNDVFLTDTGMLPQEEMVVLYFPDAERRYLQRETVTVDAAQAADRPRCIMTQLLSARESGQTASCIPDGTALLGISVENGICTVNLSSQFAENLEQSFSAERMAVYSIVNSLTELPEISSVDLLISGAPVETLYVMDLSSGVVRDESVLATASEKGVADVTIYPVCDGNDLLAPIPLTLAISDELTAANAAITALIDYESRNGMRSCIPTGTKLLSLRMENRTCILDLTAEFLDGCTNEAEERLAVRSVIATMTALPGIQSVEILVEGLEPVYRDTALSATRQADRSWFTE